MRGWNLRGDKRKPQRFEGWVRKHSDGVDRVLSSRLVAVFKPATANFLSDFNTRIIQFIHLRDGIRVYASPAERFNIGVASIR